MHVSIIIDASHTGSNMGIPLVSSVSAGFALGLARRAEFMNSHIILCFIQL
jgi:hypothetical protein